MTALKEEWRSCVYTQQFISQSRSTLLRDNEKRRVENTERVSYRSFDFSFFFFSNFSRFYILLSTQRPAVYSKRAILERAGQRNRSRGNSATFQKRLTSPRDIRTRNFLLFSKLFSLSLEPSKMYSSNVVLASLSPRDLETRWR